MPQNKLDEILARLQSLHSEFEKELERTLKEKREFFQYTLRKGKVQFKKQTRLLQRQQKIGLIQYLKKAQIKHIISSPIIYSLIIPLVFLDFLITIYQHICFRLYDIPVVRRSKYIVIDRQHLNYLNIIEKINCVYCGYGNGLMSYTREIIAQTEKYWCPIKHAKKTVDSHRFVEGFVDYGDGKAYREKLGKLRQELRQEKH